MLSALVGFVVCGFSLWGMVCWFSEVVSFLKGFLPVGFFLAGLLVLVAGLSRMGKKPGPTSKTSPK